MDVKFFKVALIQMSCTLDTQDNLEKAIFNIKSAANLGADVVCLPELFKSQYFCQSEDVESFNLVEPIPSETTRKLSEAALENGVVLFASLFEKRAPGLYHNTSVVFERNGKTIGLYRKMHIPDDPSYYEKYYFTQGDLGYKAFDTSCGKLGTLVCWDQWYPEGARLTALAGANVIFYPTAIGWHPHEKDIHGMNQLDAWKTVQRGHAIANGVFVASVNRVGHEKYNTDGAGIEFWGNSFICDPQGVILAEGSSNKEEILIADIDLNRLENVRRNWPFLRDRRIDSYSEITKRYID